jgi:hypothetical protein
MSRNYTVSLTAAQRRILRQIISDDDSSALQIRNARILLRSDRTLNDLSDRTIARTFRISAAAVERVQKRFAEQGLDIAVNLRSNRNEDLTSNSPNNSPSNSPSEDSAIVVQSAPDAQTLVDFGTGKITIDSDGTTSITFPGGSVNVGKNGVPLIRLGNLLGNSGTLVGGNSVNFPGGRVEVEEDGRSFIQVPGVNIRYDPQEGLVVEYPGGRFSAAPDEQGRVTFPTGNLNFETGIPNVPANPGFSEAINDPNSFTSQFTNWFNQINGSP